MRILPQSLVVLFLLGCAANVARADGFFAPKIAVSSQIVRSPRQEALIVVDKGTVTVALRTYFRQGPEDLAWVVPVPAEPTEVRKGDDELLDALESYTAPHFLLARGGGLGCGCGSLGGMQQVTDSVIVKQSGDAGIFHWTVLAATDAEALSRWFEENQYRMPVGAERVLAHYVGKGWHWLAMKVRPEVLDAPTLAPHPIVYTYKSDEVVYPLAISQLSADVENEIVLYVLADRRYACVNWSNRVIETSDIDKTSDSPSGTTYEAVLRRETERSLGHLFVTEYAGQRAGSWLHEMLKEELPRAPAATHLTRLRALMTPRAMDRDVVLAPTDAGDVENGHDLAARDAQRGRRAAIACGMVFAALVGVRLLASPHRTRRREMGAIACVMLACLALATL